MMKWKIIPGESKEVYAFGGLWNKDYLGDIQYRNNLSAKANLDVKNFVGYYHSSYRLRNLENAEKRFIWGSGFQTSFWPIIYVLLELHFVFETDNGVEFE